jgi:hypothetical protein
MPMPSGAQLVEPNAEQLPLVLEEARKLLRRGGSVDTFVKDGVVPGSLISGGGTYAGLGSAQEFDFDRKSVAIYFPTSREAESHGRWHDYCREHGYPAGDLIGADKGPDSEYPPPPCSTGKGDWVGLTWGKIRTALREDAEPKQLSIFEFDEETRAKARAMVAAQGG